MSGPDVAAWRRGQRARLLAERETMSPESRQHAASAVAARLGDFLATKRIATLGLYWPIKHEINLLAWADALVRQTGIVLCLPVVIAPKQPLEYWRWRQGEPLGRGIWNIPVPARREVAVPELMLAPLVGFDRDNYRLGYGGGYFDRTLAALEPRPLVVGIGYEFSALDTIFPQPHDIAMDAVLTEQRCTARQEEP